MIRVQTNLEVADNSGARKIQCIKVLGGSKKQTASIGDLIKITVKSADPNKHVKKGEVHFAVIVTTRKKIKRKDGSSISFDKNAAVLVNNKKEPIGTRIFGAVAHELRGKNKSSQSSMKIISLAPEVL